MPENYWEIIGEKPSKQYPPDGFHIWRNKIVHYYKCLVNEECPSRVRDRRAQMQHKNKFHGVQGEGAVVMHPD